MTGTSVTIPSDKSSTHAGTMSTAEEASDKNWEKSDWGREIHHDNMPTLDATSNLILNGSDAGIHVEPTTCRHCLQPLISAKERLSGFCCLGCRAAHDFINTLGLTNFYELRERDPNWTIKPVERSSSQYKFFDDPLFANSFIVNESEQQSRVMFQIPGIHCAACIWLLEKLPEVIPGLLQVRVDLMRGTAVVRFNPKDILPSAIAQTFTQLGYLPHPISIDGTRSETKSRDRVFAAQLGVAAFAAMNVMLLFFARHQGYLTSIESSYAALIAWVSLALSIPVVTFSALPFYQTSLGSLRLRRLHIDLPIAIAILGGFLASAVNTVLGRKEIYFDTVTALVFLLLLGRWAQRFMMKRIGSATDLLHSLAPLSAIRIDSHGNHEEVFTGSLTPGDTLAIQAGASIPCDGIVSAGQSQVNNSLLTGESKLTPIAMGSEVFAGTKNIDAEIELKVSAVGAGTRLGKLVEEIKHSPVTGSKIARFVDRISFFFVIGVLALSIVTFFLWIESGPWVAWDHIIALLVVSCPCALGIATPITLSLAGIRAARRGMLLKNGEALERLASVTEVVFDKTGTLTCGEPGVVHSELMTNTFGWDEVWGMVAALEGNVEHPVAEALIKHANKHTACAIMLSQKIEVEGFGVRGVDFSGHTLHLGSLSWLGSEGVITPARDMALVHDLTARAWTVVGLSRDNELVALLALSDHLRLEASTVIESLKKRRISSVILSGDSGNVVQEVGRALKIDQERCFSEFTPEQKAEFIRTRGPTTSFVGDGANDGLALSRAGVGVGIRGGAEICMAVSDIFLLRPDLSLIVDAIDGAKATVAQIHRHLLISLVYNIVAATLAVTGHIGPLAAALVMPFSSFSVLASSLWRAPFPKREV